MDNYLAASRLGEYPPLATSTSVNKLLINLTSRRPCWRQKKKQTNKQRWPCERSKPVFWELNSIFMQNLSFVSINQYGHWSHNEHPLLQFYLECDKENKKLVLDAVKNNSFGKDFPTAPFINCTCITVILTLFQKRVEFESQNACIIMCVNLAFFCFVSARATFQLQKIFDVAFPESEAEMISS